MKHKKAFKQALQTLQHDDKDKFHSKAQKVKVELMCDLWEKAEKYFDPETKELPALLGGGAVASATNKVFQADLTTAEMQHLSSLLSDMINMMESQLLVEKSDAAYYWELCNPEDMSTISAYKELNESKHFIKNYKKQLKKLQQIQAKIKRSLRR